MPFLKIEYRIYHACNCCIRGKYVCKLHAYFSRSRGGSQITVASVQARYTLTKYKEKKTIEERVTLPTIFQDNHTSFNKVHSLRHIEPIFEKKKENRSDIVSIFKLF